ncbi:MAG: hypothetical protein VYE22_14725 [Myxococcota bacterium]|nr:hypothetical protein [Myxococcota bacterium]
MPDLAFVLLSRAERPDLGRLVAALRELGFAEADADAPTEADGPAVVSLGGDTRLLVMLMPAPPPDAAMMAGPMTPPPDELAAAPAHYVVTTLGLEGDVREKDRTLAALTAAVVRASPATAAMLGHGRLFYDASLFAELAADAAQHGEVPIEIVVDVTAAAEPDDRMSFLSHGLERYGREDFFVTAPVSGRGALDFLLGLVRWMIEDPNKSLPTGDTVGRDAKERIRIQREPSPVDPARTVVRLDLPS